MTSPRRRLEVLRTLVHLDPEAFAVLLPNMNQSILENIYQCVANVVYHSKTMLTPELRWHLSEIVSGNEKRLQFLAGKRNSKLKKKRLITKMARDVQTVLSVAVPLLLLSSEVR